MYVFDQLAHLQDAADGAFVARLRCQQTNVEQAPDTIMVNAEIGAIIRAQQRTDAHLKTRCAADTDPKYLFLAQEMKRHAAKRR